MSTMSTTATTETPRTKPATRRLAWAGFAAMAGCAAACAVPVVAAAFLGGAGAGVAARFAVPGLELAVGGLAFVVTFGAIAWRERSRRAAACGTRAMSASEPEAAAEAEIPVACDPHVFSAAERQEHYELARNVIVRRPTRRDDVEGGYLFHYEGTEELFLSLARWIASEHRCCAWASFSLEVDPFAVGSRGAIRLRMSGPGGKELLAKGFEMLETESAAGPFLRPAGKITAASLTGRPAGGCGC